MKGYKVSALKYRPTEFGQVVGQNSITQTIQNSIDTKQLAQAILFCGPRGVGKTSCARILARKINTSLNEKNTNEYAFNIFELDAASNNSVEDIRKINEQVRIPPQIGSYKVYIIDEAHMLSTAAFNAFLKTLEEPPKHVVFILATTEKNKIIPTIISRCQVYDFKNITKIDIKNHLKQISIKQNIEYDEEALYLIADQAQGSMRDALSVFDRMVSYTNAKLKYDIVAENLNILDFNSYYNITNKIINQEIPEVILLLEKILKKGFNLLDIISGLGAHFRNLILCRDEKTKILIESSIEIQSKYTEQSKLVDQNYLINSIGLINECEVNYRNSINKRLHVEFCLLHITSQSFTFKKKKIIPDSFFLIKKPHNKESFDINMPSKADVYSKEINHDFKENNLKKVIEINEVINPSPNKVSSYSLNSIKLKNENKKQIVDESLINEPSEIFNQEKLVSIWNSYTEKKIKNNEHNVASILKIGVPKIMTKNIISYSVLNEMNKVELLSEKEFLIPYLKKKLNNFQIEIQIDVKEGIKKDVYLSEKEKFQILLKLNPELKNLIENFDLEL